MAVYTKKYNGSAWVTAPVKKWNGSAWVDAKVSKWTGSAWAQLYPETAVTTSKTISSTSFNTWRDSKWLNKNTARQGVYNSNGACMGYLGLNAANFPGTGSITSVGSATFTGVRGGAGYYNNNQTLRFHRNNGAPSSTPGTPTGQFNATTGGPGSGKTMSNRAITINAEVTNWANQVGSKPYLYIYSTSTSDYADIQNSCSLSLNNYVYTARTLSFDSETARSSGLTPAMYKSVTGKEPFHSMTVYEEEENMTLEEIIQRRVDGIVEDIPYDSIIDAPEILPWTREYEVYEPKVENQKDKSVKPNTMFKIEVFHMGMEDEAQYSLDNEEWFTLKGENAEDEYLYGELPRDFNKYKDFIYVRIINKEKEFIYNEQIIEPKIYIPGQTSGLILPGNIDLETVLPPIESFKA